VKANGSHYVIVPTSNFLLLGTITKVGRIILVESILVVLFLLINTAYTVRKHGETTDGLWHKTDISIIVIYERRLRAGHARIACQVNCDVSGQQQEPSFIAA
jgi:hypothetical protein